MIALYSRRLGRPPAVVWGCHFFSSGRRGPCDSSLYVIFASRRRQGARFDSWFKGSNTTQRCLICHAKFSDFKVCGQAWQPEANSGGEVIVVLLWLLVAELVDELFALFGLL
jgi:hypothetical protein